MRVYVNNQGTEIMNADFYDAIAKSLGGEIDKKKFRETHNDELEELKMSVRIAERNHNTNPCAYTERMVALAKNNLDRLRG
jgi:hypothetical protein